MSLVMDGPFQFLSSLESDFSSGYLEDALLEFGDRSKRRRLLLYTGDGRTKVPDSLPQSYWDLPGSFNCMSHGFSDEQIMSSSMSDVSEEGNYIFTETKTSEEEVSAPGAMDYNSSPSSYCKDFSANTKPLFCNELTRASKDYKTPRFGDCDEEERKSKSKRSIVTRVVYPFALVKPGGVEGDMTINDINERILMPPTRPVRHPVGDFACRPCVPSPNGTGLSGKAVVALTRIHTQGRRGTITIIRTRG